MNFVQASCCTFAATILLCLFIGALSQPEPETSAYIVLQPIAEPPTLTQNPIPKPTQNTETHIVTYTGTNRLILTDWDLTFGANPQYAFIDTSVTHNGSNSIRVEPDAAGAREVNRELSLDVSPGDHVYVECYIKVGASSTGKDGDHWYGGRIGVDLYGGGHILFSHPTEDEAYDQWVPFGTSDWVLRTWDFIVPSTVYTEDINGTAIDPSAQISSMIPWLQVIPYTDTGAGYFASTILYINPSETGNIPVLVSALMIQRR